MTYHLFPQCFMPQHTQSSAVYFLKTTFRTGGMFAFRSELLADVVGSQSSSKSSSLGKNSSSRSPPPFQVRIILFTTLGSSFETTTLFKHQFGISLSPPFASEGNVCLRTSLHVRPWGCGEDLQRQPHKPAASTLSFYKIGFVQSGAYNTLVVQMLFNAFKSADTATEQDYNTELVCIDPGAEHNRLRPAWHRSPFDPPRRLMKSPSGSSRSLNCRRVPQRPRPFAPRPVIDLVTISRAKDYSRKRLWLPDRIVPSQVQAGMAIRFGEKS